MCGKEQANQDGDKSGKPPKRRIVIHDKNIGERNAKSLPFVLCGITLATVTCFFAGTWILGGNFFNLGKESCANKRVTY